MYHNLRHLKLKLQVTSQISACRKTMILWKMIADIANGPEKVHPGVHAMYDATYDVVGDRSYGSRARFVMHIKEVASVQVGQHGMLYNCPCCEFNGSSWSTDTPCMNCPMIDFWDYSGYGVSEIDRYNTPCSMHEGSPYYFFRIDPHYHNAVHMYQTAEEAMNYWVAMREMNEVW